MKVIVVYDSQTGNTEKMAKAVAEGAGSVAEVDVKKVGEPFPLMVLAEADGVIFGSPCIYANVTPGLRGLVENMGAYVKSGKIDVKGHHAAIFGSYGWDGAWVMEEVFKLSLKNLGYKVQDEVCVEVASNIKYNESESLKKCKEFGKKFAESL
jgi:flavorubredoxin